MAASVRKRWRRGRPLLLLLLLLVVSAGAVHAAVCPLTGDPAPAVVTLMASKRNPATDAWVVRPDCHVDVEPLDGGQLMFTRENLERVDSVPSAATYVNLHPHTLSRGADLSTASKLKNLMISSASTDLALPSSLTEIHIYESPLTSIADVTFPASLQKLSVTLTPLKSLRGVKLPAALETLYLEKNQLTSIDGVFPPQLTTLEIHSNAISKIERITLPSSLETIRLRDCDITSVRGVKWPQSMKTISLDGTIVNFEIQRSDLPTLKKAAQGLFVDVVQATCADSTAEIAVVMGKRLCVISDERFDAVYVSGNGITPNAPTTSKPTGTSATHPTDKTMSPTPDSEGNTGDGSKSTDPSSSQGGDTSSSRGAVHSTGANGGSNQTTASETSSSSEDQNESQGSSSGSRLGSRSPRGSGPTSSTTTTTLTKSSSSVPMVVGVCGGIAVLILLLWVLRYCCSRASSEKDGEEMDDNLETGYKSVSTPIVINTNRSMSGAYNSYRSNDVRNDKALIPFRIEQSDLPLGSLIAKTNSSVIYKATFQDENVAVKQLLPGVWEFDDKLRRFMDEIRTCASLEHHKIVAFVGISWSSLRDLSVVMEYMPLGDLSTLLYNQQDEPKTQEWSEMWTRTIIKSKASIAQDVAEAVVYLHSFKNPILHRNLKTRNVLLDNEGNAKLSGFGISRESTMDDTMTGEIGTAAWVAPEVFRGERYDEKADIYSLGVLVVELDRCQHPYASEAVLQGRGVQQPVAAPGQRIVHHVAHKNTQIAVLVSAGKLRPSVSSECPDQIASVVTKCLSFDPADRPTSLEVYYGLRQARKALEQR